MNHSKLFRLRLMTSGCPNLPDKAVRAACRLCLRHKKLRRSHIVPAFVFRWLRNTSATGFLRFGLVPNRREQDGWKVHLLCGECEARLSGLERRFRSELFDSITQGSKPAHDHGRDSVRAVASILWRALVYFLDDAALHPELHRNQLLPKQRALIPDALECWRRYAVGKSQTLGQHVIQLVPLGVLSAYENLAVHPNFNYWSRRTVEIDIGSNDKAAFIFVKMGPIVTLGFIQDVTGIQWQGTLLNPAGGAVGGTMAIPETVLNYFFARAENATLNHLRLSAAQKARVVESLRQNPARSAVSDTIQTMNRDIEMFGAERVFRSPGK